MFTEKSKSVHLQNRKRPPVCFVRRALFLWSDFWKIRFPEDSISRRLDLQKMEWNLTGSEHLGLSAMTGKEDQLSAVGFSQPVQSRVEPVVVVLGKAVVKDQRVFFLLPVLQKLCRRQTEGQINLIDGAAADAFQRNQAGARI